MDSNMLYRKIALKGILPLEVAEFISDSMGLDPTLPYENRVMYIRDISNYPKIPTNWKKWTKTEWSKLATFVNPYTNWNINELVISYQDIILGRTNYTRFGSRTSENPTIGDIVNAYEQASNVGYRMKKDTSFGDLISFLTLYRLKGIKLSLIQTCIPLNDLHYAFICEDLDGIIMPLERMDTINHPPFSEWDAYCSLLSRGIDAVYANSKLVEYYNESSFENGYISSLMQDISIVNPLRLRVGHYFNPLIPIQYYNPLFLKNMAKLEDIGITDIDFIYEELQLRAHVNTFHHLLQPEAKNSTSPIEFSYPKETHPMLRVTYGILSWNKRDIEESKMLFYTISELSHAFRSTRTFTTGIGCTENFNDDVIRKLYNISRGLLSSGGDKIVIDTATELVKTIDYVRAAVSQENAMIISKINKIDHEKLVDGLRALMDLAMYMRGWNGKSPYPIRPEDSEYPHMDIVDERVYKSRLVFDEMDKDLNGMISDLPLMAYEYGNFRSVNNPGDGKTIKERLIIIDKGNMITSLTSCVKWSSNLFVASAYYYLMLIDKTPEEFTIFQMKKIG
jgi:hypothetical protein